MVADACNPATWEAEAELLEPGRWGLQWAEIRPLHSSLATKLDSVSKKKKELGMVVGACNPSYLGGWGRRITWTQGAEVVMIRDHAIALQPGQQEQNSVSKKKRTLQRNEWRDEERNYWQLGAEMGNCSWFALLQFFQFQSKPCVLTGGFRESCRVM